MWCSLSVLIVAEEHFDFKHLKAEEQESQNSQSVSQCFISTAADHKSKRKSLCCYWFHNKLASLQTVSVSPEIQSQAEARWWIVSQNSLKSFCPDLHTLFCQSTEHKHGAAVIDIVFFFTINKVKRRWLLRSPGCFFPPGFETPGFQRMYNAWVSLEWVQLKCVCYITVSNVFIWSNWSNLPASCVGLKYKKSTIKSTIAIN